MGSTLPKGVADFSQPQLCWSEESLLNKACGSVQFPISHHYRYLSNLRMKFNSRRDRNYMASVAMCHLTN